MTRLWQIPNRLSPLWAKVVAGLTIFNLAIAASGVVLYEGWPRVTHVSALGLVGLTNLAWALGSILPEERGGKGLRDAVAPFSMLMLVALFAAVVTSLDDFTGEVPPISVLAALVVFVVLRLPKET